MIIVNLKGGLGNQIFQYAVGRHLSIKLNVPLALDVSGFATDPLRNYRLDSFNIKAELVSPVTNSLQQKLINRFRSPKNPLNRLFQRKHQMVRENGFPFQENILNSPDNSYLDGYWQSEKYFLPIQEMIRQDLTLVQPLPPHLQELVKQIHNTNSISLHVRRGDYASNPVTTAYHGLYSTEWYANAAAQMQKDVSDAHFFIFSDDYEWVRSNIKLDGPCTFVQPSPDGQEAQDLYVMSQCKHNIIANSSFSWWAAWLNAHSNKKVIAPARWFVGDHSDTKDLIPQGWTRI
jgi:hypothetical protein